MYEVILLNERGYKFTKYFDSEYLYRRFLEKAKRSVELVIVSYGRMMQVNRIYYTEIESEEVSQENLKFTLSDGTQIEVNFRFNIKKDTVDGYLEVIELED